MARDLAARFAGLDLRRAGVAIPTEEKARALAALRAMFPPADNAVLLSDPDPLRFSLAFFHLLDAGYQPVPLSPSLSDEQLAASARAMPHAHLLRSGALARASQTGPGRRGTYACHTSGTTSAPKPCVLSIEGALANAAAHADSLGINAGSWLLQNLPIHHSYGLCAYLFTALATGCILDFHSVPVTFRLLASRPLNGAVLHVSPSQAAFLQRDKAGAPEGLAAVSVGGGLGDPAMLRALRAKLPESVKLFVTYGLTEAGPRVSTGEVRADYSPGFLGKAIPGVELGVVVGEKVLSAGEGRLCVRSPSLKLNLAPEETLEGYLLTRDQVRLSDTGEIFFRARADDLIKVGGVSVYPQDIERAVRLHPGVRDCVVLKEADPVYEEVPVLFVETDERDPAVFTEFLKDKLDLAQMPREVRALEKFPRHSLDKIDRAALLAGVKGGSRG